MLLSHNKYLYIDNQKQYANLTEYISQRQPITITTLSLARIQNAIPSLQIKDIFQKYGVIELDEGICVGDSDCNDSIDDASDMEINDHMEMSE